MGYDLLFQQAVKYHENGNLSAAENIYRQILETAPDNADVLNLMGLIAQAKGLHDQACGWFYQAIKQAPVASFYFNLGLSLFNDNKPYEAIEAYQKALSLQSTMKEAYNYLAEVYRDLGNTTKAIDNYKKAIELDAGYLEARINLAFMEKNTTVLEHIAAENPNNAMAVYYLSLLYDNETAYSFLKSHSFEIYDIQLRLGELALKLGREEALQYFEKALIFNPRSGVALVNLGNIAASNKEFEKAENLYKRAIELNKDDFAAHAGYGRMLYLDNRKSEALEEYRAAVILNPDSPEVSNNLGLILKDLGEYTEALGLFFNAFMKNQSQEEYQINIAETLTLLYYQEPETAQKIAANWHSKVPDNPFAAHLEAALKGEKSEINSIYTQKLFDHFADNYELVLANIGYSLPREFRKITGLVKGTLVDLGCGSGLIGVAYQTDFSEINGVYLSEKMLAKAEGKNCYRRLIKDDIIAFMEKEGSTLHPDLITAADVCCYMENLEDLFKVCAPYPFIFSIEKAGADIKTSQLSPTGRWQHNVDYVAELVGKYYKNVKQYQTILRQENGQDVKGIIFYCQ